MPSSIATTPIKVGIYDDIVNIVSPGGFPSTLTAEALQEGRSEIRNRVVARIFKELGYIEQWGSGIQRIKSACKAIGLAEPRIREKGDFVDVEFYRPVADTEEKVPDTQEKVRKRPVKPESDTGTIAKVSDNTEKVPDTDREVSDSSGKAAAQQQRILSYLRAHQTVNSKYVETLIGVKEARARRVLSEMVDKGLIEKQGRARSTCYVLAQTSQGASNV
jgi:ATP-dependent DNA helicase RecG